MTLEIGLVLGAIALFVVLDWYVQTGKPFSEINYGTGGDVSRKDIRNARVHCRFAGRA